MSEVVSVDCGVRLSIDQVDQLYTACESAIASGCHIHFDASHVEYCDTAGLQLVLSLQNTLMARDCEFHWQSPTEVLIQTAKYLGLVSLLKFPQA